jgi:crotonobetainyl-CoA hydratase
MPAAMRWAEQILQCAPLSIRASKESTMVGMGLPLEEAMKKTYPGAVAMHQSEDFIEGPKAFSEKRKPNWKGK